jgi:hypothetical protein
VAEGSRGGAIVSAPPRFLRLLNAPSLKIEVIAQRSSGMRRASVVPSPASIRIIAQAAYLLGFCAAGMGASGCQRRIGGNTVTESDKGGEGNSKQCDADEHQTSRKSAP